MTKQLNPQPGDIVHVRAIVTDTTASASLCKFNNMDSRVLWLDCDQILAIEPRPLKVGDFVMHCGCECKVITIHGESAWIWHKGSGYHFTIALSDAKRIAPTKDPES